MKILFLQTGGTIDKNYEEKAGVYNFTILEPAVKRVLQKINPSFEFEIETVLRKDSLDMDDNDRKKVLDACKNTLFDRIVITHGTDTMTKTAKELVELEGKTVVLVGSAKPEKFSDTDAQFNIGVAVGAINGLKPGVYIAMNGRIYDWDKCVKDPETGRFIDKK